MNPNDIDIPFEKFVLDNGLRLIVHEDHKAPIAAVNVWYHVGSKNEKPGKTGYAHLFEHLMFNGSEHFNDDYFIPLEKAGATDLNGTTNSDRTNYFQNVPTSALDLALWMESDRMGHLLGALDQAKLDEQRGVVKNEKRQGENRPYGKVHDLITENTYPPGHPYSWTTIGSMADLDAATLDDMREWFLAYYGAANAVISIAGDVAAEDVRRRVEHFFGDIAPGPPVERMTSWVAAGRGELRQSMEDEVPQARLYKIWNIPGSNSAVTDALDLVSDVLGLGKNSRLYRRLVHDEQIATDAAAYIDRREIAGQFVIQASAQPGGDLSELERAVDEELALLLEKGPSSEEVERIQAQYFARVVRAAERIGGFGGKSDILARNEVFAGRPDFYKQRLRRVAEASPGQLQQAARRWLDGGAYVLEVLPRARLAASAAGADRSRAPALGSSPELKFPALERATLSNGLKLIVAQRPETPVVEIELLADAGFAADPRDLPGAMNFAMTMIDEGTARRSALEISDQLARLGAGFSAGSNLDSSMAVLSTLKGELDAALEIFADIVVNPAFPDSELSRIKKQTLARIEQEKANPAVLARRILPALIFGRGHAYASPLTGSGTADSVERLSREDLRHAHRSWFQPSNAVLIAVGAVTLSEMVEKLEQHLAGWRDQAQPPEKNLGPGESGGGRVLYLLDKPGAEQSVILGGLAAPPSSSADRIAVDMMNDILGGTFTSRINMNLREDKHWTYGARCGLVAARGPRPYLISAPVQADKTREALAELIGEMRDIADSRPPTAEELDKAAKHRTLRLPGAYETKHAVRAAIREIVAFGLPDDDPVTYAARVRSLRLDDVSAAARNVIRAERVRWVVVGEASRLAEELRALDFDEIRLLDSDGNRLE